ncbi:WecB/TagA/CpsF family glycosyltransferase [Jeotgalibacillus soli]|uniref:N-acetylglucosaminyldiphosphoundecaprenol N-acetyl-beta-D-mannosaminyltransferase n=1 Tax=Jeotgalibacillus soli TaxID=889306 RepID=A0A0C2W181_9BACL|nr:WecB/TagA/CpsF family glycosyltransferase [Jeotgalibacillus soli]KIL49893.1 acetylmannosaminyltransferase [Jeotgalibacillus soli]
MNLKEEILGVNVTALPIETLLEDIDRRIENKDKGRIVAINPEKIMMAQKDPELSKLLNDSAYQIPDGVGVSIASKLLGGSIRWRITGVGMMENLLQRASEKQYRVFFYGAKEETVVKAIGKIKQLHPEIQVAGYLNGYEKDDSVIIDRINEANADIVFVALGSPRQELFIERNMDKLSPAIYQGVGGSFDVFSGNVKRAPIFFRKLGLEWLYRLISQPSRLKRQLALPRFLLLILKQKKRNA